MDNRPIGIFDSGVGGLTVVKEVLAQIPGENIVYLGDTARVPYGTKSIETVKRFSVENSKFLLGFDVKLIVVACNTASSLSLPYLESQFNIPFAGVIKPGVKEALNSSKNRSIGVIATPTTIASGSYQEHIKQIDPKVLVYPKSCPLFVPLAEEGWIDNDVALLITTKYLKELKDKGIDTLILGCTHYPLLIDIISKVMGDKVTIISSGPEVAKEVKGILTEKNLLSKNKSGGKIKFFTTDDTEKFKAVGNKFLGSSLDKIKIEKVNNV